MIWRRTSPVLKRGLATLNQATWRADRQPKVSIFASPDGSGLMTPNHRYKFLADPPTVAVSLHWLFQSWRNQMCRQLLPKVMELMHRSTDR